MVFTLQQFEFLLVIFARISGFVFTAPFFNLKNVPRSVKTGLSVALTILLFTSMEYEPLSYTGVVGYAVVVAQDFLCGIILGFLANICYQILAFAGQLIDMEIGFSMVNEFDPVTSAQITVSGDFYAYAVMLMLMVTYMHHYLLRALIDSYQLIPIGGVVINPLIYSVMVRFMTDYFVLAFRIVLPIFGAMLLVNTILAILAKAAPQMNMFVIGMQLKVLVGLVVLAVMIDLLPAVSDYIFNEMMGVIRDAIPYLHA